MKQYIDMLRYILDNGELVANGRTKEAYYSVFGYQTRYNLADGFPLVTTKKVFTKGIIHELLWLLSGDTNIKYLTDNNVHIWDEWADKNGNLGPVYGKQWREWEGIDYSTCEQSNHYASGTGYELMYRTKYIDQIEQVIQQIKHDPSSRRLIVSAWNPVDIPRQALPPCHTMFQFKVSHGNKLSCQLYQRSADAFLGVPFNIASYALLTHMIAKVCGLEVGEFIHTFGDLHIYENHVEQVKLQLKREPKPLPSLWLNPSVKDIDSFKFEDILIIDYQSHPAIKGDVAI